MKKITIIGTGYVGLVTGACLAEMGNQVTCLDIDKEKIEMLKKGHPPFYEPGLEELVLRNKKANRLHFTDRYEEAIPETEVLFLALPTPCNDDGSCDLSYVELAAKELAQYIDKYIVVVNKSTVPVGTSHRVRKILEDVIGDRAEFDVVSNPEFLREGAAISDCMKPDRIILGVENQKSAKIMKDLYEPFSVHHDRVLVMDIASAELAKYASNAMLASRLSLMNHLATLCETLGANIKDVRIAMGLDERIGYHYLNPGIGFGGSCLPKDVKALRCIAQERGLKTPLLDSILEVNESQKERFFQKIQNYFENLEGKNSGHLGPCFQAGHR